MRRGRRPGRPAAGPCRRGPRTGPARAVPAGYASSGQGERGELAGLVLDSGLNPRTAGHQGRRVTAGQPEAIRRPAGPFSVRQRACRLGIWRAGRAEGEDHLGAGVSRGEGILGLGGGVRAERVAERVDDPARIAVPDGQVTGRVPGPVRGDDLDPAVQVAGGHPAQDRVDEAGRPRAADVLGQVDGGRHGGVVTDPGGQQLVCAEPEHVAHRRVDLVPVAAGGQDGVIGAAAAQRAVGQFGGEGGVPAGDAALGEQGREQQVGVGVAVRDRAQDVIGGAPRRVGARPGGPGTVRGPAGMVPARTGARCAPRDVRGHVSRTARDRRSAGRGPTPGRSCGACPGPGRRRGGPGGSRCRRAPPGGRPAARRARGPDRSHRR